MLKQLHKEGKLHLAGDLKDNVIYIYILLYTKQPLHDSVSRMTWWWHEASQEVLREV